MKLTIYVHDLHAEIGHSRALIEKINHLPPEVLARLDEIEVYACTCSPLERPFQLPKHVKLYWTPAPGAGMRPFLLKAMTYHLASALHSLKQGPRRLRISVGIAALKADVVDVQFLHRQWPQHYFRGRRLSPWAWAYKKILFLYLELCERLALGRPHARILALSSFVAQDIARFLRPGMAPPEIAYSGVNFEGFRPLPGGKEEALRLLTQAHPEMRRPDLARPILVFVGAFERKGLPGVLEWLSRHPQDAQILCVGESEKGRDFKFPANVEVMHIPRTTQINACYNLGDAFVFPTSYEPFGLVILEAAAVGLSVFVTKQNVGASELLENLPWVHFIRSAEELGSGTFHILPHAERLRRREIIMQRGLGWEAAGAALGRALSAAEAGLAPDP